MKLIDTHCHLDAAAFDSDRQQVLTYSRQAGVEGFIVPGVVAEDWRKIRSLSEQEKDVFPAYGLHPMFMSSHSTTDLDLLAFWIQDNPVIAVGEIGLDFFLKDSDRGSQQALFESQLNIARDFDLPVILHVRKAHDDVIQHLRHIAVPGGTVHAFSGSMQQAKQYLDMGFKLGFGGMLTYPRSRKLRELATCLPLSGIVLETDAPDMTVASHQGERNSPEYLPECLAALVSLRKESLEMICEVTTGNAISVFNLPQQSELEGH